MKRSPLDPHDQMTIENLQLRAENHRLQSLIYDMQLTRKIEELAEKYGRQAMEFNPQTLTWDVRDEES